MPDDTTDHYFTAEPGGVDRRREVSARIWDRDFTFTTSTGVFSHERLDKATTLLLRHHAPPERGTILDLGCGWGPVACAIAAVAPDTSVWAVDVNERALELTRLNAERAGTAVQAVRPEQVPADVTFDQIWSNPPIRVGKEALHELLLHWLPRLTPDGVAHLVVGKNLGADSLQAWLGDQGWPTERVATDKGFRILRVGR